MITFTQEMKTPVEIYNMGYRSDGAAKHLLFQRRGDTDILNRVLQTEAEVEDVLYFLAEIVIGHLNGVGTTLIQNQKQLVDMLQRGNLLQKCKRDQMGDLTGRILLFNGICDQSLFHIVSDHRTGHILKPQRADALIHIFGCLLQIITHIRDLMIPWETKSTYGAGKRVSDLFIHRLIITPAA